MDSSASTPSPPSFLDVCDNAYFHINECVKQHPKLALIQNFAWLKITPNAPVIEHLSFRCGSDLYFIFVDSEITPLSSMHPTRVQHYIDTCITAKAIPCYVTMRKTSDDQFVPELDGWGLRHMITREKIDPIETYSEELVELSDWEVQELAVNYVATYIVRDGFKILQKCSYLDEHISIWIEDESGLFVIIIKAGRGIHDFNEIPANIDAIVHSLERQLEDKSYPKPSVVFVPINIWDPYNGVDHGKLYRCRPIAAKFRNSPNNALTFEPITTSSSQSP